MSYLNQKSLIVVGGVIAALFAGTVLLGGYARSVPAFKPQTDSPMQAKGCCPMMGAQAAQEGEASCPQAAKAAFNVEACPADCTKPCCAKETATTGCADSADAAGGCCPATTESATK